MKKRRIILLGFILLLNPVFAETLRFVLVADPQIEFASENPGYDRQFFAMTVHEVNNLMPPAEFALILGDLVNASSNIVQWDDYFSAVEKLTIPYYEVVGNHDGYSPQGLNRWRDTWGKQDYYTFTHKGVFFMGLNSYLFRDPEALPDETTAQKNFISTELADHAANPHKFIFQHYPLYLNEPSEPYESRANLPVPERKFLLDQIDTYGVKAVFSGHRHYEIANDYNGTLMLTCNSSSLPLGNGKRGYYIVDYDIGAQSVSYQFIENTETKLEAFIYSGYTNRAASRAVKRKTEDPDSGFLHRLKLWRH